MDQQALLEKLFTILSYSGTAYKDYLAGGKTFRLAKELKLQNSAALALLLENRSVIDADLSPEFESLITHYTAWTAKWEKLAAETNPGPADEFIFANDIMFPGEAVKKLEAAYTPVSSPSVTIHKK